MNRVQVDDPITLVFANTTLCTVVESVGRKTFNCGGDHPDLGTGALIEHDDEDKLWVRGWHTPDSDAVKAARAAQALGDKVPRQHRPSYQALAEQVVSLQQAKMKLEEQLAMARGRAQLPQWGGEQPRHNESYSDIAARMKGRW